MSGGFGNSDECVPVVPRLGPIFALVSARCASMDNAVLGDGALDADGLHHAAAEGAPISRLHIDMLAPQTSRTVIGIARPHYVCTAMRACEIFDAFLEAHREWSVTRVDFCSVPPDCGEHERTIVSVAGDCGVVCITLVPSLELARIEPFTATLHGSALRIPTLAHEIVIGCPRRAELGCAMTRAALGTAARGAGDGGCNPNDGGIMMEGGVGAGVGMDVGARATLGTDCGAGKMLPRFAIELHGYGYTMSGSVLTMQYGSSRTCACEPGKGTPTGRGTITGVPNGVVCRPTVTWGGASTLIVGTPTCSHVLGGTDSNWYVAGTVPPLISSAV